MNMNTKKEIKSQIKHFLAVAEVKAKTANAEMRRQKAEQRCGGGNADIILYRDIASGYTGQTTPNDVGVCNFCLKLRSYLPQYRTAQFSDDATIDEIVALCWKEEQKKHSAKAHMHQFKDALAKAFAEAEIELDTPLARRVMTPYLKDCIFDSLGMDELETVAEEIAVSYSGKEKLGKRLETTAFKKFQQYISAEYGVAVLADDTLEKAAIKVYEAARKAKIKAIQAEIEAWSISRADLYPDDVHYGH